MASTRACGQGAAQVLGTRMGGTCLQGCLHPFACRGQLPEGGWSSSGQARTVVVPQSRGCHGQECGWDKAGHGCLKAMLTHGTIKGDKDKIWKVQRGNEGMSGLFVPAGPPVQALGGSAANPLTAP